MQTKPELELADADRMLAAARAEAERHGWAVSIARGGAGGPQPAISAPDGASPGPTYIAQANARAAARRPRG
ncbi:heme-binding protein, partial [Burkholderia contaminans]|uniref:heme-binding protein n=1 Tax=Burkholderia contaminans TaxID=488447 RepID=UPI001C968B15